MKLPFYVQPIEEYEVDIAMPMQEVRKKLTSLYRRRQFDQSEADNIIPTMIYRYYSHFRIKVSDDRRISRNPYMNSYYARLELEPTAGNKCKGKVCIVYDHGYSFALLLSFLINLIGLVVFLILPVIPVVKIYYGIYFLVSAILIAVSIFTENRKFYPDIDRLKDAVKKYTDMLNRWND